MPAYTNHYGLVKLLPGEKGSVDNYAFYTRNLDSIDLKLFGGNEGHHHNGEAGDLADPVIGLSCTLSATPGYIPAGVTVRYRFTWVNAAGEETGPSEETTINTPAPIATPGRPILSAQYDPSGILLGGNYWYILSAWVGNTNQETAGGANAYITLPVPTSNVSPNAVLLTMPTVPAGADGWNIYKRSPGTTTYNFLDSIEADELTYLDDGTVALNCNRSAPNGNNTNASYAVDLVLPGATPTIPAGCTWRIYRTYTVNDWDSSYLAWVVEETFEGSGIIVTTYTDIGTATQVGRYPTQSQISGSPDPVDLTDSAEVQGVLPPGKNVIPVTINFTSAGPVEVADGTFIWVNEYDEFDIISVRASLGVDSEPSTTPVIADVKAWNGSSWNSVIFDAGDRPSVPVGEMIGDRYTLDPDVDSVSLDTGHALRVDVMQAGGGATPTDYNLMVTVFALAHAGSTTVTHDFV